MTIVVVALTLGIAAGVLVIAGAPYTQGRRTLWAVNVLNFSFALVATGLYIRSRRPASRYPAALISIAYLNFAVIFAGAPHPLLNCVGLIAEALVIVGAGYLVLSFPTGGLGPVQKVAFICTASIIVGGRIVLVTLAGDVSTFSPVGNPAASPFSDPFGPGWSVFPGWMLAGLRAYGRMATVVVASAIVVTGLTAGSAWRRRFRIPMALILASALALYIGFSVTALTGSHPSWLLWLLFGAGLGLGWMFLITLMAGPTLAVAPLLRLVTANRAGGDLHEAQATLQRVLHDLYLRLAIGGASPVGYVDVEGVPIGPAEVKPEQRWTELASSHQEPAAAMIHDGAMGDAPVFLDVATGAASLVVANAVLTAQIERAADDLTRARQRARGAAELARRGLEHDLQDRAGQMLRDARRALAETREAARGRSVNALVEVEAILLGLQEGLNDLTHFLEPRLLGEDGLGAALAAVAALVPARISLHVDGVRRHSRRVESAIYFCCTEAVQNSLRHGGDSARVQVFLWEIQNRLYFEVRDSGIGFDMWSTAAAGLKGMADRIDADGGWISVWSQPGEGTVVLGWVPADPIDR